MTDTKVQNFDEAIRYIETEMPNALWTLSNILNHVHVVLGSVNHKYTSRAQIESVLYPMAYYFFREDTEL